MSSHNAAVIALVAVCLSPSMVRAGSIRFVDDDAPAGGDGTTWDTAYRFLQDALGEAAGAGGAISEIHIAQGIYRPDRDEAGQVTPGDRAATFQFVAGLTLRGGYLGLSAGPDEDPGERDTDLYETVLSGDLLGDDEPDFANNDDNSLHVLTASSVDDSAVLDGATITAGNADGPQGPDFADAGAGMLSILSSTAVSNCRFQSNHAQRGGALFILGLNPQVTGCDFLANRAVLSGGAIHSEFSDAAVDDCSFVENVVADSPFACGVGTCGGGGMYIRSGTVTVTGCHFEGHSADMGGAAFLVNVQGTTFSNCVFMGNQGLHSGGAVFIWTGSSLVEFSNCTFMNNSVTASLSFGGAIRDLGNGLTLVNCAFIGNTANTDGGGFHGNSGGDRKFVNCLFNGNSAQGGAAVWLGDLCELSELVNCTIWAHSGWTTLCVSGTHTILTNSIMWENTSAEIEAIGPVLISYSLLRHAFLGAPIIGDGVLLNAAPLFVDPDGKDGQPGNEDDDLRLLPSSPAIDSADNGALPDGVEQDLDGNPRFVDGDEDGTTIVDMGVYESQGDSFCLADVVPNGIVDPGDLAALLGAWGPYAPCPPIVSADLNSDCQIDAADLAILLTAWGPCS